MKKRFLLAILLFVVVACCVALNSCKAQRIITADGRTIVKHGDSQDVDSVRCTFVLRESYIGVSKKY